MHRCALEFFTIIKGAAKFALLHLFVCDASLAYSGYSLLWNTLNFNAFLSIFCSFLKRCCVVYYHHQQQ